MMVMLLLFFILNIVVVYKVYVVFDGFMVIMCVIVIGFGVFSFVVFECGNFIIFCFIFFMLGNSCVFNLVCLKWVVVVILINFKFYFIMSFVGLFFSCKWCWFEGCCIVGLVVYFVMFVFNGDGNLI